MKNTILIILSILFILSLGYILLQSTEPTKEQIEIITERDELQLQNNRLQAKYDLTALLNHKKLVELLAAKVMVKRSEDQLIKSKANEKVYLRTIKELVSKMSDSQADSVIKERFKNDPDSLDQKSVLEFARLDACDSVRSVQDQTIFSLRNYVLKADSSRQALDSMNRYSRQQISILQLSQDKDKQIIDLKEKEVKKLKRREKFLKVLTPVCVVLTVILMI